MSVDRAALDAAVDELRAILRPDGADLELIDTDQPGQVRLRVDLADVECLECVIDPDMLDQMIGDGVRRRVGAVDVVIDDPRRAVGNA